MKVDIRVPVGLPVQDTADFIAGCEAAGFSGVGVHDHQHSGRDVFVTLALAAERTTWLNLYPATSNPVTRHPMVLASLAHSLEEIAPERVRLTVGPGYLSVGNIGRPRARVAAMREAILTIRRLLRGELGGVQRSRKPAAQYQRPADAGFHDRRRAANGGVGRRSCRRRPTDWSACIPKQWMRPADDWRSERLVRAAASTDFRPSSSPRRRCRMTARPPVAFPNSGSGTDQPYLKYPSDSNLVWLREAGIDLADDFVPESISDAQAAEICDAFGLFGTPEECLARLKRARAESGIDHVFIFPTHTQEGGYDMPRAEVDAFRKTIIPGLGVHVIRM